MVKVTSLGGNSVEPKNIVCLDDYLAPHKQWDMSRQKRMDLALNLSLAILQFVSTDWIDKLWTWKDFCMLKGDKSQIFVTKRFYSSHSRLNSISQDSNQTTSKSMFSICCGEPVLTRLGFALIELAFGKRLSDFRQAENNITEDEDMLDLMTATELVESNKVHEEAGQGYHDVVNACLKHQVMMTSGVKGLSSKHENFQSDLEQFVVAPIRDYYNSSWGQMPEV
jgi:hypothetical protein